MYSSSPGESTIDHDGIPVGIGLPFNFERNVDEIVLSTSPSDLVCGDDIVDEATDL